ncbi:MAG: hypothetical protein FWC38_03535 [Proteobacteria bacterium]|nr:hypothetical protein [Pseudomonadota bacterium]MCL2307300.1 hypothetical protein [Pseudomonadota bacterium]
MRQANTLDFKTTVKVIGASGQISLGKQFAGRQVLIEAQDEGVWLIRTAQVVPDNERWLHEEALQTRLKKSLDWAKSHAPKETENPVAYLEKLQDGRSRKT